MRANLLQQSGFLGYVHRAQRKKSWIILWKKLKGVATTEGETTLSRDQLLALQRTGIDKSDAGAIMGSSRWASSLTAYYDNLRQRSFDGNNATAWRTRMESVIRKWCYKGETAIPFIGQQKTKLEIVPVMFRSIKYPYMTANLGGLINLKTKCVYKNTKAQGLVAIKLKVANTGATLTKTLSLTATIGKCNIT